MIELYPQLDDLLELRHQANALGIASTRLVNTQFTGLYASVFRGSGLDFDEVREYQEGDDVRNMDWKVTARTNSPHLKIFREERERSVVLCVDQGTHMGFGTRGTFKSVQAARVAALLGWAANAVHDRVGGVLYGNGNTGMQHFRPTKDRRALWRLLKALSQPVAERNPSQDSLLTALLHAESGVATAGLIILIGDFNREIESLEAPLGRLCQRHTLVIVPIDDPGDSEMPDMGRTVFSARDGRMLEINTSDPQGRETYRREWRENRDSLLRVTNRLGISCIPITTRDEVHKALMIGLQRAARRKAMA
jgi:uncharacterized protein (DUF58 family)